MPFTAHLSMLRSGHAPSRPLRFGAPSRLPHVSLLSQRASTAALALACGDIHATPPPRPSVPRFAVLDPPHPTHLTVFFVRPLLMPPPTWEYRRRRCHGSASRMRATAGGTPAGCSPGGTGGVSRVTVESAWGLAVLSSWVSSNPNQPGRSIYCQHEALISLDA